MESAASTSSEQVVRKKRVVIGLPGNRFSDKFLLSFVSSLYVLWESNKYEVIISPAYSSFVSFTRMQNLGLSVLRGVDQKPFNGMEFDVYVTIDSDIVFTPESLIELINNTEVHPVVSGIYRMSDLTHVACVKDWDTSYFMQHGTFEFMTLDSVKAWKEATKQKFMEVSYNGLGFFACRKEVLDAMKYPFFDQELQEMVTPEGKILRDMCSEDVAFCKNIQKAGYTVNVNVDLVVGHEKPIVI
jgi:glycosyltransferase involved in cell wall biosynthesis